MTDITYQTATIGTADQSAFYRGSAPGAAFSPKAPEKARKSLRVTTHYRGFRPRNSPGAALTVR